MQLMQAKGYFSSGFQMDFEFRNMRYEFDKQFFYIHWKMYELTIIVI